MLTLMLHRVIWIVEAQMKERGLPGSAVRKLMIVNGEHVPQRATIILVNEKIGA